MINGYKVSGPNGNFIFLPYAGYMDGYNLCDDGSVGCYWSLSPHEEIADYAYYLEFILYDVEWSKGNFIYYGFSVRAVCP